MLKVFIFAALVSIAAAEQVTMLRPCGKGKGFGSAQVTELRITPCPEAKNKKPCLLKKNTNATIEIDFIPNIKKKVNAVTGKAYWANNVADLPLPNMNATACAFMTCPLETGKATTYTYGLNIAKSFPNKRYDVKWRLTGGGFNLCLVFPILVQ